MEILPTRNVTPAILKTAKRAGFFQLEDALLSLIDTCDYIHMYLNQKEVDEGTAFRHLEVRVSKLAKYPLHPISCSSSTTRRARVVERPSIGDSSAHRTCWGTNGPKGNAWTVEV